jgi:aromatic ring-opening dioxygenase catalytic subunit (LigB family)
MHIFPKADVPVVQLGIDETLTPQQHQDLASRLQVLRDEGIMIFGSGNAVHNLHAYAWGRRPVEPYEWAVRFESRLRELVMAQDLASVVAYETLGQARDSVDHVHDQVEAVQVVQRGARMPARAASVGRRRGARGAPPGTSA